MQTSSKLIDTIRSVRPHATCDKGKYTLDSGLSNFIVGEFNKLSSTEKINVLMSLVCDDKEADMPISTSVDYVLGSKIDLTVHQVLLVLLVITVMVLPTFVMLFLSNTNYFDKLQHIWHIIYGMYFS